MKLLCALMIIMFLATGVQANEIENINVYVDDMEISFDTEPYIKSGYTMVPMRAIMEALHATIGWEEETKTATAVQGADITKFIIGSHDYYKNGALQYMPMAAEQINNRTYVPLRAISECFGYKVDWDGNTNTVYISSQKNSVPEENLYYIKSKDNKYLALNDNKVISSDTKDTGAVWVLECINGDEGLFCIYNFENLTNSVSCCYHPDTTSTDNVTENDKQQVQSEENTTDENIAEKIQPEETEDSIAQAESSKIRLEDLSATEQAEYIPGICEINNHCWKITPTDNGGYTLSPEEIEANLSADTAKLEKKAEVYLVPVV